MHNFFTKYGNFLEICKTFLKKIKPYTKNPRYEIISRNCNSILYLAATKVLFFALRTKDERKRQKLVERAVSYEPATLSLRRPRDYKSTRGCRGCFAIASQSKGYREYKEILKP